MSIFKEKISTTLYEYRKHVLQSPVFVQLNSFTKHLSSQIEKVCCQPDSTFSKFLLSSHRTLLANLLLCRHSGRLVVRRLRDKYLSSHLNVKTDSRLFVTQKVLLGGSLISFAQDKITDEEVLITLKGFSVNADSYNSNESSPFVIENDASKEDSNLLVVEGLTQNELCESWDPPLTLMIRELRETYLRRISMFIRPNMESVSSDNPCVSYRDEDPPVNEISNEDYFTASLFSLLTSLNIQPDGTSFVDGSWELIYDRPSMHIWRRPLKVLQINGERSSSKSNNKYEYRVCGQFNDISAASFLEVQLNLDYRRRWDDKIVELHCLTSHGRHSNDLDIIRWVVRFPFPMVNREYIYVRRWWMQPVDKFCMQIEKSLASHKTNPSQSVILPQHSASINSISTKRYAYVISRCSVDFKEQCIQSLNASSAEPLNKPASWVSTRRRNLVQVREYHSEMLIESHGEFNQNGLNYYLVYYDDPCLPISGSPMKLFSVKAIEEFVAKLHKAALHLCNEGLPVGIYPIVYNNNNIINDNGIMVDTNPNAINESLTKDKPFNGRKLRSYFFTDPRPSETNNYIDSTSAALS
ncbi:hypothetical protein MN116_005242 [Schistosoma mekongi]|uniref:START domain-containing protein n=1 Tax=Schistosoma mekongi TaxID=38744 RepID=A0AAE2D5E9_SCHME|nr:hypothetical protein MN116_005242 [Schistosoma mekongi]